ncbi:MAG: peptidoglycan-binding protein [Ruminococcus sp.]|nr:peptidoglycan-binding protein [Ruminococcus sp.]
MFKKLPAIILCLIMVLTLALTLGGCADDDGNYPVTVGQTIFKEKPEKVAVMSDNLADIIYYMGYSTQICAISDACTQEELTKYIDSVGDEVTPDADAIIASGAEYVLTDTPLSSAVSEKLKDNDIEVINLMLPTNDDQLKTVYNALGKIFGGSIDGAKAGTDAHTRLTETLTQAEKETEGSTIVKLVCYLYLDENNALCSFNNTTCEGMVLDYVSATNVASNFPEEKVDESILRLSNPDYIFYDNEAVLEYLNSKPALKDMTALSSNNTFVLPKSSLQRLGTSMIDTQSFMLSKMFPNSVSEATKGESLASRYGITITEDSHYELGADHQDVKAIQRRLLDLGYLVLDDNTATTYYGSKTAQAVTDFQTANGLQVTGIADKATLEALFLSSTLSTQGVAVTPSVSNTQETTAPTEPEAEATTPNTPVDTNGYNIDLSISKSYQKGDEHEDIKAIQQRLEELLYLSFGEGDSYTSYFGDGTENAISLFQQSNGLTATGVADYDTLKLLFSDNAKQP